ncbi:MAG TPA: recombinase family protein [Gemmataceae bacterium]|nr:recombinase family protein [Gemmataceae bacterium]
MTAFCEPFGFTLSKRVWIDDGVSAFHGLNATPEHELGQFIAEARKGLILPGACLLIENWDRLSRQDPWASISLINDLRQVGIHVGRLDRMKLLRCDSTDTGDFLEAAIELIRGHSESAAKSMRNGAAWKRKREAARKSRAIITRRLPAWIEKRDGELRLIPERAATLRLIYQLRASGYGYPQIVGRLTREGIEPFGERFVREGRKRSQFAGSWTVPYVVRLLTDRRAVGEFQPCSKGRKPDGKAKGSGQGPRRPAEDHPWRRPFKRQK